MTIVIFIGPEKSGFPTVWQYTIEAWFRLSMWAYVLVSEQIITLLTNHIT